MKIFKRILSALLILCLQLNFLTGCGAGDAPESASIDDAPTTNQVETAASAPESASIDDAPTTNQVETVASVPESAETTVLENELLRAQDVGLVPDHWMENLEQQVTHQEFCSLITGLIQKTRPECLSVWEELSSTAADSDIVIGRDDAAVGLMYAAQALGICYVTVSDFPDSEKVTGNPNSWAFKETSPLWPELPEQCQMLQRTPGTPLGTEFYHDSWGAATNTAFWFVLLRRSLVNERPLLDYDENYNLRMGENLTRGEAVTAVLRLGESESNLLKENRYFSVYEPTAYSTEIITDELLHKQSKLPVPTQENLTDQWRGIGISKEKDTEGSYYRDFQEAEIAFLSENGLNFTRIFFSLSSLQYPDFPQDWQLINEQELLELDQLIAWGMEYDVHIQISASTMLGGETNLDVSEEDWEHFCAYWEALAQRYRGISSQYVTFDLLNELMPSQDMLSTATEHMRQLVESIRSADPDRVLLVSVPFPDNPLDGWAEGIASLGVALGCHPYRPVYIAKGDDYYYADGDPCWPYPYFPHRLLPEETLTISGDLGGKDLRLDFWSYAPFTVTFDDGESITVDVEGDYIHDQSCSPRFYEPYAIHIPVGVRELVLTPVDNEVRFQEIGIQSETESHWLIPHDEMTGNNTGGADLVWTDLSGWSSEKNCTAEFVYHDCIEPLQKIAEEYHVGFMVNEMGSYAAGKGWDVSVKVAYDSDILDMLEKHSISWCMCELDYMVSNSINGLFDDWINADVKPYTHISEDGYQHSFKYSDELLQVYCKYGK